MKASILNVEALSLEVEWRIGLRLLVQTRHGKRIVISCKFGAHEPVRQIEKRFQYMARQLKLARTKR